MTDARADVVIMGGGLAGLTLALQLRQRLRDLDILVLERQRHPVPKATHKVGESCVEIGAHYFDTVLGLKSHLTEHQIKKFGFRFFFSEGRLDIDQVLELGASRHLSTPSYQLDRGIFENFLACEARRNGVRFADGAVIRNFELNSGTADHQVSYSHQQTQHTVHTPWLIDASGRAGLIKRRLGLAQQNGHEATAVWFRVGHRIDINNWSADPEWINRCTPPERWRSTNHLVGPGYWVWLIPLSSGSHSVGIVADARMHPTESLNSFEKSIVWLRRHQPRLAQELEGQQTCVQDFAWLRRYSYGCERVFSADRWAMTGEAGVFLDPFYSPGSDFIAIGNTYITDLIARERKGGAIQARADIYQRLYQSFYDSMLSIYRDQYPIFGSPGVLPVKVLWDYTYYWGVLCQIFFQHKLTDMAALSELRELLTSTQRLNYAMQILLRNWSALGGGENPKAMLDQAELGWFAELNRGLTDTLDGEGFRRRIRSTTTQLHALAGEILDVACSQQPALDGSEVRGLLAGEGVGSCSRLLFDSQTVH
ncbi:MAG: NAD(P)/FAD-dependent oxidoreductase [Burkholderiales bacterium]